MTSKDKHNRELQHRIETRLREMETNIKRASAPFYQTVKQQTANSPQPWKKKAILAAKLFGLGVAVLVAVRVVSALVGIVIIAALIWLGYKLFFDSPK